MDLLLSALTWDPQIRGFIIVLVSFLILPGSVYLLLATNTGARIGFVLAAAGFFGWMAVMGAVWMVFGIGYKGTDPHWKVEEVVTAPGGEIAKVTTVEAAQDLPGGKWERLTTGNPILGDAQAAADKVLAPGAADEGGHGGGGAEEEETFDSPFSQPEDYVQVAGFRKGGERKGPLGLDFRPFNVLHEPHYAVVQVQPALRQTSPADPFGAGGAPGQPSADTTQSVTTVVMVRDLGSRRFPPFVITVASTLIFAVLCYWLHQRDKEILRLRELSPAAA